MKSEARWLFYLAYGSNLHPLRLCRRVPSAQLLGTVVCPGFGLRFHKTGQDGSGKCTILETGEAGSVIHGAVYRIPEEEKWRLDQAEGLGKGYREQVFEVVLDGTSLPCFTYIAEEAFINPGLRPFAWYHQLVLLGAGFHGFPPAYIDREIRSVQAEEDPDPLREDFHRRLLDEIRQAGGR